MINLDDRIFEQIKTDSQMWLLLHIAKRINKDMFCFPTNYTLSKDCGWGMNKVQKVKAQLKQLGLIDVSKRMVKGQQRANNYTVTTDHIGIYISLKKLQGTLFEGNLKQGTPNEGRLNEGTLKESNRSINQNEVLKDISINKEDINGKNLPIPSFSDFWDLYDYKKNKDTSRKSWKKLTDLEKMRTIETIPQYLVYLAKNNHPQCHASTWLNQKRWEDDNSIKLNGTAQPNLLPPTLTTTTKLTTHSAEQVWICFKNVYKAKREKELVGDEFKMSYHESDRTIEKELFEIGKEAQLNYNFIPLISELEKTHPELYGKMQTLYEQKQKSKLR